MSPIATHRHHDDYSSHPGHCIAFGCPDYGYWLSKCRTYAPTCWAHRTTACIGCGTKGSAWHPLWCYDCDPDNNHPPADRPGSAGFPCAVFGDASNHHHHHHHHHDDDSQRLARKRQASRDSGGGSVKSRVISLDDRDFGRKRGACDDGDDGGLSPGTKAPRVFLKRGLGDVDNIGDGAPTVPAARKARTSYWTCPFDA